MKILLLFFMVSSAAYSQTTVLFTNLPATLMTTNASTEMRVPIPLVAWYPLSNTLADASGYGNNLTSSAAIFYTNGPTGVSNGAIILNGSTAFLAFSNSFATRFDASRPFSVSVWEWFVSPISRQYILGNLDSANGFIGWDVELDPSLNKPALLMVRVVSTSEISVLAGAVTISAATWYHIVFTYNGSGKASGVSTYYNGTKVGNGAIIDNLSGSISTTNLAMVGIRSGGALPFNGRLAGIQIYQKSLSTNEVYRIYTNGTIGNIF